MGTSIVFWQRYGAAVKASFQVYLRIAKAKKPHTIAIELIQPCAKDINLILIGKKAESKLNILSPLNNTVQCRISQMSEVIKDQAIDQLTSAGPFAMQLGESTDVSSCAQLPTFVLYIYNGEFKDEFHCNIN